MPASAIIMLVIVSLIFLVGIGTCTWIAFKKKDKT